MGPIEGLHSTAWCFLMLNKHTGAMSRYSASVQKAVMMRVACLGDRSFLRLGVTRDHCNIRQKERRVLLNGTWYTSNLNKCVATGVPSRFVNPNVPFLPIIPVCYTRIGLQNACTDNSGCVV